MLSPTRAVADAVAAGDVELVLSTVVLAEIIIARSPPGVGPAVEALAVAPGVRLVDVDVTVARRASLSRGTGLAEEPSRKLRTPDALILATAVLHADVLHSNDGHLLAVGGRPIVGGLPVTPAAPPAD